MRGTTARSDTERRDVPPKKKKKFFFSNGVRVRRESALDRAFLEFGIHRSSSLTQLFPVLHPSTDDTSRFLSAPATRIAARRVNDRQRTCVFAFIGIPQNFLNSIPIDDSFSLRFDICSEDDWSRWRILVSRPFPMRVSLDSEKNSPGRYIRIPRGPTNLMYNLV